MNFISENSRSFGLEEILIEVNIILLSYLGILISGTEISVIHLYHLIEIFRTSFFFISSPKLNYVQ